MPEIWIAPELNPKNLTAQGENIHLYNQFTGEKAKMIAQARMREVIDQRVGERNNSEKWNCEMLKKELSLPTELFCTRKPGQL